VAPTRTNALLVQHLGKHFWLASYVIRVLRYPRLDGTAKLIRALIDNGADLTSRLDCIQAGVEDRAGFRELRLAGEVDALPSDLDDTSVSFSVSVISVLSYIMDSMKMLEDRETLLPCLLSYQLPDVLEEERVVNVLARVDDEIRKEEERRYGHSEI
jgi:hypothetical protein